MENTEIITPKNLLIRSNIQPLLDINFPHDRLLYREYLKRSFYSKTGKKFFEFFLLILIAFPVIALIIILFFLLVIPNKGRVFFRQKRMGLNGRWFTIYKFRTLTGPIEVNTEKDMEVIKKNSLFMGVFLRKTGLDEILQILNVIRGEMNLIGPRPLPLKDIEQLSGSQFIIRHLVKPGICGLWQIRRKYFNDIGSLRYDEFYLKKQSLLIDSYIVFYSLVYMIKGKGR